MLAVRGGLAVPPVLGSRSSDLLSGTGPAPLRAGDRLPAGPARAAVQPWAEPAPALPAPGEVVALDVVLGPREDWFSPATVEGFLRQEWTVTPRSNRVGLRLAGEPLPRATSGAAAGELPSEGTVAGAVQVPPDGQPVVFSVDHPVTGGYPVVACVAAHHLDLLAQVPAGSRVRFHPLPRRGTPS